MMEIGDIMRGICIPLLGSRLFHRGVDFGVEVELPRRFNSLDEIFDEPEITNEDHAKADYFREFTARTELGGRQAITAPIHVGYYDFFVFAYVASHEFSPRTVKQFATLVKSGFRKADFLFRYINAIYVGIGREAL